MNLNALKWFAVAVTTALYSIQSFSENYSKLEHYFQSQKS